MSARDRAGARPIPGAPGRAGRAARPTRRRARATGGPGGDRPDLGDEGQVGQRVLPETRSISRRSASSAGGLHGEVDAQCVAALDPGGPAGATAHGQVRVVGRAAELADDLAPLVDAELADGLAGRDEAAVDPSAGADHPPPDLADLAGQQCAYGEGDPERGVDRPLVDHVPAQRAVGEGVRPVVDGEQEQPATAAVAEVDLAAGESGEDVAPVGAGAGHSAVHQQRGRSGDLPGVDREAAVHQVLTVERPGQAGGGRVDPESVDGRQVGPRRWCGHRVREEGRLGVAGSAGVVPGAGAGGRAGRPMVLGVTHLRAPHRGSGRCGEHVHIIRERCQRT